MLTLDGYAAPPANARGPAETISSAYYEGRLVTFTPVRAAKGQKPFTIGPWRIGTAAQRVKPNNKHLNFYLVVPGTQRTATGWEDYDHNDVISGLPKTAEPVDWDIYFAIVLDPKLLNQYQYQSESELLLATQGDFSPDDQFEFGDIPGAGFLRDFLHIKSVQDLEQYRRHDGKLPRLIIVPAGIKIRAAAVDPEAPQEKKSVPGSLSIVKKHTSGNSQ